MKFPENNINFEKILNYAHDCISVVDSDARTLWANKAWKKVFEKNLNTGNPFDKLHPDDLKNVQKKWADLKKKNKPIKDAQYRFKNADGQYLLFETSAIKENDLYYVFAHNITEKNRIHQKLQDNVKQLELTKKRFEDIALSSADWIWEVDKNTKYVFASDGVKKILGYTPEELLGKTPFDFMPPAEKKRVRIAFRKIAAGKKPIINLENWNLTKKGKKILLLTNGVPILDEKGHLIGYRGIDKDMTQEKKSEEAMQKKMDELELFNKLSINRELKMVELKNEITRLKNTNK